MRTTIRLANKIYNIGTPMLGRWSSRGEASLRVRNPNHWLGLRSLTYNYSIQNRKVYLTNMDHCGCCEVTISKKEQIEETSTASDEHLLPYCL